MTTNFDWACGDFYAPNPSLLLSHISRKSCPIYTAFVRGVVGVMLYTAFVRGVVGAMPYTAFVRGVV